jgi:DnaJ-class molecular chaperone
MGDGKPGDALVEIEVKPHRFFTREDDDIHVSLPISLAEAVLGSEVRVPTTTGVVSMKVPKGSSTGAVLRLRGKGAPRPDGGRGDQYVNLKVVLPDKIDPELEEFMTNWAAGKTQNPREGMEG